MAEETKSPDEKATLQGTDLAELLLRARNATGLSQAQVATNLKEMGEDAGPTSVSRAENGPGPRHVAKAKREALARGYELHFVLVPVSEGSGGAESGAVNDELDSLIRRVESTARATVAQLRELKQQAEEARAPVRRPRSVSGGRARA